MNNLVEQDHRFTKRRVGQSQWFQSFYTAKHTLDGYETTHMIRKRQVKSVAGNNTMGQIKMINKLFGIGA